MRTLVFSESIRSYGLNPAEWVIDKIQARNGYTRIQIAHREDRSIRLDGKLDLTQVNPKNWLKSLRLVSI